MAKRTFQGAVYGVVLGGLGLGVWSVVAPQPAGHAPPVTAPQTHPPEIAPHPLSMPAQAPAVSSVSNQFDQTAPAVQKPASPKPVEVEAGPTPQPKKEAASAPKRPDVSGAMSPGSVALDAWPRPLEPLMTPQTGPTLQSIEGPGGTLQDAVTGAEN